MDKRSWRACWKGCEKPSWHAEQRSGCNTRALHIPYQLWTGASWDGGKEGLCMHAADSRFNVNGTSPTRIKGPLEWANPRTLAVHGLGAEQGRRIEEAVLHLPRGRHRPGIREISPDALVIPRQQPFRQRRTSWSATTFRMNPSNSGRRVSVACRSTRSYQGHPGRVRRCRPLLVRGAVRGGSGAQRRPEAVHPQTRLRDPGGRRRVGPARRRPPSSPWWKPATSTWCSTTSAPRG